MKPPPRSPRYLDQPTVISRPQLIQPRRWGWLLGCALLTVLPLVILIGIAGGIFIAARQSGRLNVLILGLDHRPGENGPARTDTLILATFDPQQPQVALLSIPRDLWVDIPGHGANRINTANYFGDLDQPGYGPRLAVQTVQQNFGLPIHGYLVLDFNGFVALIDALGGLDIEVPQTIMDDRYPTPDYGITTITIPAGPQHMDGATALIYSRTRHADSDFGRGQRQQQVLRALVVRVLQPTTWPRLPAAWVVARSYFLTDLSEVDLATIFLSVMLVGPQGLQSYAIDEEVTIPYVTDAGAQVLLPRWEVILPLAAEIFQQ